MNAKTRALCLIESILENHVRERFFYRLWLIIGIFVFLLFLHLGAPVLILGMLVFLMFVLACNLYLLHRERENNTALKDAVSCWYEFRQQLSNEAGFLYFVSLVKKTEEDFEGEKLGRTPRVQHYRDRFSAYKNATTKSC